MKRRLFCILVSLSFIIVAWCTLEFSSSATNYNNNLFIIANSQTKSYDGMPLKDDSYICSGMLNGNDVVIATVEGTITDVGKASNIVTSFNIVNVKTGEDVTSSYNIVTVEGILEVTQKEISINNIKVCDKVYDGTTEATVNYNTYGIADLSEVKVVSYGRFSDKNVGNGKNVTVNFYLEGDGKDNYKLNISEANVKANITARELTVLDTMVYDKVFDRQTVANASIGTLNGVINGDAVTAIISSANFEDSNAGYYKKAVVSYSLYGSDSNNYIVANSTHTANISTKDGSLCKVTGIVSKIYTGASQVQYITVKDDAYTLDANDYYVSYNNNIDAGTAEIKIHFRGNYFNVINETFSIIKADPDSPDIILNITANTSDTLSDIKLPEGFTWVDDSNTSVGDVGNNTFNVKYTPTDSNNYNAIYTTVNVNVQEKSDGGDNDVSDNDKNSHTHNYGFWKSIGSSTHVRICSACGYREETEHSWSKGTVNSYFSDTGNGVITYVCTDCGETKTESFSGGIDKSIIKEDQLILIEKLILERISDSQTVEIPDTCDD